MAHCPVPTSTSDFFYFYIFQNRFFTEIYFWFHNLQFRTPTARLRGGRPPAALLPGGRDLNVKKIIFIRILGLGGRLPPGSRAAGARRPVAGR